MKWRLPLLLSLVAVTLVYRVLTIDLWLVDPGIVGNTGLTTAVSGQSVYVAAVAETSTDGDPSPALQSGVAPQDRIIAITPPAGARHEVNSYLDYGRLLREIRPGERWTLEVGRLDGEIEIPIVIAMEPSRPESWTLRQWLTRLGIHVWLPLLGILAALLIGVAKPKDDQAQLAALMFLSFSSIFYERAFGLPGWFQAIGLFHRTTCLHLAPFLFFLFFMVFPSRSWIDRRIPWLKYTLFVLTGLAWAYSLIVNFADHAAWEPVLALRTWLLETGLARPLSALANTVFMFGLVLLGFVSLLINFVQERSAQGRRRIGLMLAGATAGLLPLFVLGISEQILGRSPGVWFYLFMAVSIGFFPLSFVYVVIRHRVFGIRMVLRRGLQYVLLSRGLLTMEVIGIFLALYFLAGPLIRKVFPNADASALAIVFAIIALTLVAGIRQLNKTLLPIIDRSFFRDAYNARRILIDLSRAVRQLTAQPERLLEAVSDKVMQSLHPDGVAVLLRDQPWPFGCPSGGPTYTESGPQERGRRKSGAHSDTGRFFVCLYKGPDEILPRDDWRGGEPLVIETRLRPFFEAFREGEPRTVEIHPEEWARGGSFLTSGHAGEELAPLWEHMRARLLVPIVSAGEVMGFLALGGKRSEEPYTREDKELLLSVAEQVAIALDYAKLIRRAAEQERLNRELEIAREVQNQLFPQHSPPLRTLSYNGICRPAQGIGGDYYDFVEVGERGLGIALGDVSGKGISAALLMAGLQAALRSAAPKRALELDGMVADVNELMCRSMDDNRFATFFYCLYDDEARTLRYVNAGHNPPILVRSNGDTSIERLGPDNMVLGLLPGTPFDQKETRLEPGDLLLIFSDGVTEAVDGEGNDFGDDRLVELVRAHRHLPADELRDRILEEIAVFAGEAPQHDDMTLIVAKVADAAAPQNEA